MPLNLILTHENADFDALASAVAAARLFADSFVLLPELLQPNVRAFVNLYRDMLPLIEPKDVKNDLGRLVVIDTNRRQRLGRWAQLLLNAEEVIVFDHHPGQVDFAADEVISEEVGAATTLVVERLRQKNIRLTDFEATLFTIGIFEDTGCLTYDISTKRDVDAVSHLWAHNINTRLLQEYLRAPLSTAQKKLFEKLMRKRDFYEIKHRRVLLSATEIDEYVIGASTLLLLLDEIEDAALTLVVIKMAENVYLAARSKEDDLDLLELLAPFKVKGYPGTVTAHLKKSDPFKLKTKIIKHLSDHLPPALIAEKAASKPVFTIDSAMSIAEADDLLNEHDIKGCPVTENGALVGMASRRDLRKGLRTGLGHAPVKGFMTRRLITAAKDDSLAHLRRLMVRHNIGRVPLVNEAGELEGIVTRSDILRHLSYLDRSGQSVKEIQAMEQEALPPGADYYYSRGGSINIAPLLKKGLSKETNALLKKIGALAEEEKIKVYLVGGIIRDLLLKHPPEKDLDFVVIGDAVSFAYKLQKMLGGKLKHFERFKTASLFFARGNRIDLATARKEYYQAPAALPKVSRSDLKDDLFRRDFTINAMACSLAADNFGLLFDYYDGRKDLQKKLVRVLNDDSFYDDPLRLLRAVRFEQRYNFMLEEKTTLLVKRAVEDNMIEKVGGQRLGQELRLIYRELSPVKVLKRFEELNLLKRLYPGVKPARPTWQLLSKIENILNWFSGLQWPKAPDTELVYLGGLFYALESSRRSAIIKKLYLSKDKSALLENAFGEISAAQKKLNWPELSPSQIVSFLEHLPAETLLLALAVTEKEPVKEHLISYITKLRDIRPKLDGNDLKNLGARPGPLYKTLIKRLRQAVLDEEVKSFEEEKAFVKSYLRAFSPKEDG